MVPRPVNFIAGEAFLNVMIRKMLSDNGVIWHLRFINLNQIGSAAIAALQKLQAFMCEH